MTQNKEEKNICENCLNNRHNFCYLVTHCDCPICHLPKEVSKKKDMITEMFEAMGIKVVDVTPIQSVESKEEIKKCCCGERQFRGIKEFIIGNICHSVDTPCYVIIPEKEGLTNNGKPHICNTIQVHNNTLKEGVYLCKNCNMPVDKEEWWSKSFTALFDKQFKCDVPIMKQFISKVVSQAQSEHNQDCTREEWYEDRLKSKIGFIRQWLNEDRITDPNKLVSSEELLSWLK